MERAMLRTAAVALAVALSAASIAAAQDPPPATDGPKASCTPSVRLFVDGRFVAGGTTSFQMSVRRASGRVRALRGPRELLVDARTRFRRHGRWVALAALRPGDDLHIFVGACRSGSASRWQLLARSVFARRAL
jgi:hypothetical protein